MGGWVPDVPLPPRDSPAEAPGPVLPGHAPPGGALPGGALPGGTLAAVRGAVTDRLPATVRGGRLDPGRTGVGALLVVALVACLAAGFMVLRSRPVPEVSPPVRTSLPATATEPGQVSGGAGSPAATVVVSVGGKVRRPGLVTLPAGSRVADAVSAAGGALPGTDTGLLNLARRLTDGEQVLVGVNAAVGDPVGGGAGAGSTGTGGRLDLNAATLEQLDALPGIGPVLARRILDWRQEHGRFASVDQLREVSGIGERIFDELGRQVTV